MSAAKFAPLVAMFVFVGPALGQSGIVPPKIEWLWPQVQARITLQTAALSPIATSNLLRSDAGATPRTLQAGGLYGDYVFAQPRFGSFRASGGLVLGNPAGAPQTGSLANGSLGIAMLDGGTIGATAEAPTLPYLGLGYTSPARWGALSLTAELGLVAGHPSGLTSLGRALLGTQAMDQALREIRIAPMLQVGLRYAF